MIKRLFVYEEQEISNEHFSDDRDLPPLNTQKEMRLGCCGYTKMLFLQRLPSCLSGIAERCCLGRIEVAYLKAVERLEHELNIINIIRDLRWTKLSINQLLSKQQR